MIVGNLSPDLSNRLFTIITVINLWHTCLSHKGLCTVLFCANKKYIDITEYHTDKICIYGKNKIKVKTKNPQKGNFSGILHQRLGHRSIMSLVSRYTANIWQDIEISVYPDPLFTSCQISTINKKHRSNTPLKTKTPFKWLSMDILQLYVPIA